VLVVADQVARRVRRQRRLACAGKAEEDGHVALVVHVRGAMHREHALERQTIVHEREDRLLDLACVERAADQNLLPRRVQDDERARPRPVVGRIGLELGRMQHDRLGLEGGELGRRGLNEHRRREQRVVRVVGDDPHRDAMRGVGAGERVHDVEVALAEIRGHLVPQALESRLGDLAVDLAPPDPALRAGLPHDELVLRRAPGVSAGVDRERPALGNSALVPRKRVGVELWRARLPAHRARAQDPMCLEAALRTR
jgi:hypothetical protein